jgi:hypothetical protein
MTATALSFSTSSANTDEQIQEPVRRLKFSEQFAPSAGTRVLGHVTAETGATPIPATTRFTFFSDGSSLKAPDPLKLRAWKSIPTSAGKTFEWEGLVIDVKESSFTSRLRNIKGAKAEDEEIAVFHLDDISPGDRDLLQPGAIFRWVIGFELRSGTRQRYSRIVFRRLPALTSRSFEKSKQQLDELIAGIQWMAHDASSAE